MKYVIITPVKNEEKYFEHTLQSIINQTIRPARWVIVDDNSTDDTVRIINKYVNINNWINLTSSKKNEERGEGAPIIKAFYEGYKYIESEDWDFIVKLDADLTLPKNYFEEIINCFEQNKKAGLVGGCIVEFKNGKKKAEHHANYHIRGALKSVRRECWFQIGGFLPIMGWDGIDIMTALYYGWETINLDIEVIHHRPTGSYYDQRKLAYIVGYSKYKNGANISLTLLRAILRIKNKPYFLYSYNYLLGYFDAMKKREEKNVSKDLANFINRFHLRRIISFDF